MWFKVDDGMAFHQKVLKAGNEAIGAWARAGSWSSAPSNLTEGYIPPEVASQIAPPRIWAKLRAAGLTEAPSDGRHGEQIHDFTVYNPRAEKVRAERDSWADRQRKSRESRRDKAVTPPTVTGVPIPIPIPGDPEHSHSASAVAGDDLAASTPPLVERIVELDPAPEPAKVDLIRFLGDLAQLGHPWATKVHNGLLEQGGRLAPGQRATLLRIRAERDAQPGASATPPWARPNSLQQPAAPGDPTWSIREEV